jgi:hypothetical protein
MPQTAIYEAAKRQPHSSRGNDEAQDGPQLLLLYVGRCNRENDEPGIENGNSPDRLDGGEAVPQRLLIEVLSMRSPEPLATPAATQ